MFKVKVNQSIFSAIIGYEDVKVLFLKALRMHGDGLPVHFLMVGEPASAKTSFLLCLSKLKDSYYLLGSRTTKAGLTSLLFEKKPKVLLLDEIDKMDAECYAMLLSLMETGRVVELLHRKYRTARLETVVFAGANDDYELPRELLSRFMVLRFKPYTWSQFIKVTKHILVGREKIKPRLARYIADAVWTTLRSKDVRDAVKLARLVRDRQDLREVKAVVKTLGKYI